MVFSVVCMTTFPCSFLNQRPSIAMVDVASVVLLNKIDSTVKVVEAGFGEAITRLEPPPHDTIPTLI